MVCRHAFSPFSLSAVDPQVLPSSPWGWLRRVPHSSCDHCLVASRDSSQRPLWACAAAAFAGENPRGKTGEASEEVCAETANGAIRKPQTAIRHNVDSGWVFNAISFAKESTRRKVRRIDGDGTSKLIALAQRQHVS